MTTSETTKVISGGIEYTKENMMKMDEVTLRGLLHERTHHGIEVPLYPSLLKWDNKPIPSLGLQPQAVFDIWRERGFAETDDDILWVKRQLDIAAQVRNGIKPAIPELADNMPKPFTEEEMKVVRKLIFKRCSARGSWAPKPVSDGIIEKIMEAGRWAPIGCNLDEVRFIVLKTDEEKKTMRSDISVDNAVVIVLCYDMRPSHVVGQDRPESVPQNRGFDCAAAADHMLLMTHALGLSGVWLSKSNASAQKFKEAWGLPETMDVALHIAVGWPEQGAIKSGRAPLDYMVYDKEKKCTVYQAKNKK